VSALERLALILVEPKEPLNIGSALRSAHNMGVRDLRVVAPAVWDPERVAVTAPRLDAEARAIPRFPTVDEAVADCGLLVAFTARGRAAGHRERTLEALVAELPALVAAQPARIGFLFGREDFGLANEDVDSCHRCVVIETAPDYRSLNLAQAVLLAAHAARRALAPGEGGSEAAPPPARALASAAAVSGVIDEAMAALRAAAFFKFPGAEGNVLSRLRVILQRAELDDRDVAMLRGAFAELRAAAETAATRAPASSGSADAPPR
jgi:TrmH family RNA methyltransferase